MHPGGGRELAFGAWALVHGVAVLWLAGNLPADDIDNAVVLFRRAARALSGGRRRPEQTADKPVALGYA